MWVRDMAGVGGQAYAVLTLCRARHRLLDGRQVSKRSAATLTAAALPGWAPLVLWAQGWWYDGGRDDELSRLPEVIRFVDETSGQLLADLPCSTRRAGAGGSPGQRARRT